MEATQVIVSVLNGLCAIAFGYAAFMRNRKKDDTESSAQVATMAANIEHIRESIDVMERKLDRMGTQHIDVVSRLTAVEESAKQAHKRIDGLCNAKRREENGVFGA